MKRRDAKGRFSGARSPEEKCAVRAQWYAARAQDPNWLIARRQAARAWRSRNPGLSGGVR
jgi:hypothetical protein